MQYSTAPAVAASRPSARLAAQTPNVESVNGTASGLRLIRNCAPATMQRNAPTGRHQKSQFILKSCGGALCEDSCGELWRVVLSRVQNVVAAPVCRSYFESDNSRA